MLKKSYVSYVKNHLNSSGENAPWVIKKHETGEIISSHLSEQAAKDHLKQMHSHSSSFNGISSIDDLLIKIAIPEKPGFDEFNDSNNYSDQNYEEDPEEQALAKKKKYRGTIFVDVIIESSENEATDKQEAQRQIEEYAAKIPNSFAGDVESFGGMINSFVKS